MARLTQLASKKKEAVGVFVLNAKEEWVLKHLEELGLSRYEGKAYFSALVLGRAKAWELARYSSVPQSRIYHVLEGLKDKGLVKMEGSRPKCVKAVPIEELTHRMVRCCDIVFSLLLESLLSVPSRRLSS